jgi:hypothetical protein
MGIKEEMEQRKFEADRARAEQIAKAIAKEKAQDAKDKRK